jgi:hypothetical protein
MDRFVLLYRGPGDKPAADVDRFRSLPGTRVIDESEPRMILVEGPEGVLIEASRSVEGWDMVRDVPIRNPGRHPFLGHPSDADV